MVSYKNVSIEKNTLKHNEQGTMLAHTLWAQCGLLIAMLQLANMQKPNMLTVNKQANMQNQTLVTVLYKPKTIDVPRF